MAEPLTDAQQIETLARRGHPCIRLVTTEEAEAMAAARDAAGTLKWPLLVWDALRGVHDGVMADQPAIAKTESAEAGLRYLAQAPSAVMMVAKDLSRWLRDDPKALRAWRDLVAHLAMYDGQRGALVMIDHEEDAPEVVARFSTRVELSLPADAEIQMIVLRTLRVMHREKPVEITIPKRDLDAIYAVLRGLPRRHVHRLIKDTVAEDNKLDTGDIATVIAGKRRLLASTGPLEAVDAPASLDDVGGLATLKGWLKQRERALSGDAMAFGVDPPKGVLLLGVQGSGKSLCAKAIATAWRRPLLRLDAGALYDKFIGESERRLRDALRQAEAMSPVVLWIDEIEKAFAGASSQSSDGGLSRRMFGALLTWMSERREPVFLVATANDIEALPPELLRKGRFDEIFFVDLPSAAARKQIFSIHLRKRKRDPAKFDLDALVTAADGFSGAEIEQAVIGGLYEALAASRELTTADVLGTIAGSPPLSKTRAEQVEALRAWGRERCKLAE